MRCRDTFYEYSQGNNRLMLDCSALRTFNKKLRDSAHQRSSEVTDFGNRKPICGFLLVNNTNFYHYVARFQLVITILVIFSLSTSGVGPLCIETHSFSVISANFIRFFELQFGIGLTSLTFESM